MHILLLLLILIAILIGPQLWTQALMRRHGSEREELPGTGAELARHLIGRFGLEGVGVEPTDRGDHYDPTARMVRLLPSNHDGRSLTAVAIAAHEVGHAIQHGGGDKGFLWAQGLIRIAVHAEKLGAYAMLAIPLVGLIARHPAPPALSLGVGLLALGANALVRLVTLPVELDASFNKALPILRDGGYVEERDLPAVRSLLRAAALTYVAAALAGLLNVWRWLRVIRR